MTIFVCSLFLPKTIQFDAFKASSPRQIEFGNGRPRAGPRQITENSEVKVVHASDLLSPYEEFPSTWRTRPSQPRTSGGCPQQTQGVGRGTQRKASEDGRGIVPHGPSSRSGSTTWDFATTTWTIIDAGQGNGGLRNAVEAAVRDSKIDHCAWIGTLGLPTDMIEGTQQKQDIEDALATEHDMLTILWPVFHYQIPDGPKSKAYEDHSWKYYINVNQRFADKIVDNWKHGGVIWVHDYHLLLVPGMVRKTVPDARIGFYLHVSFPSSEVYRCLAVRQQLLEGMLGANIIGFQVQEYASHFLQTCSRLLAVESTHEGVQLEDRFVDVAKVTIGIDPPKLEKHRGAADVMRWIGTLQDRYKGKRLIVGRDKLDHNGGGTSLGHRGPHQFCVGNLAYQPVVYLKQDIGYAQYLALLSIADALMITSQREGLDLTPHEYIVCQDGKINPYQKHGPLILSEFTGASSLFNGNDLTVNPWSYLPRLSIPDVLAKFRNSSRRLILLGFEGTLVNWGPVNQVIPISPQRALAVLNDLLLDDRNIVYVMSGRRQEELDGIVRMVPKLGVIAENGCFVRDCGSNEWTNMTNSAHVEEWKKSVKSLLTYFHERTPGTEIEERHCSLRFHYRNAEDMETASRRASACASQINDAYESQHVHAVSADHSVIVEPTECKAVNAAQKVFNDLKARLRAGSHESLVDFLMVLGAGRHDEKVFK
ncbi:hypothetical protein ACCO45_000022 [Purpureocillium lilacinum]|uniref:Uncharacterized protein n=1 Tax=Purpureocillium lilacinum TaxID=33203 RepID=A0ACC4ECD4_PURLI